MKRSANFSYYRLLFIALGMMLFLTSCEEIGLFRNFPNTEEIQSPEGFDPGMGLSSKYLICPTIPKTVPIIPPGPYDEDIGDCALRGKSAEIEIWLTELETIIASCLANQESNWAAALDARDYLDDQIDELENRGTVIPPNLSTSFTAAQIKEQQLHQNQMSSLSTDEEWSQLNPHTDYLKRISKNATDYCAKTDQIIKPLWMACIGISYHHDDEVLHLDQYHSIIEAAMNDAQTNYDLTDSFYRDNLLNGGWDDFRSSFNPASLDCPLDPQAPNTKFTFSQNAFCRRGPSSEYEEVATFLTDQEVLILGRNHHEPRWWVIPNPGAKGQCWVSDSTGAAEGPLEELEIVAPPPLVINSPSNDQAPSCSKTLGSYACVAAGGTWVDGGATGASYCDCP